jgi:entericidin B
MIKRIFSPVLAALVFASFLSSLAGCNTMEGAGKDIEEGGRAIKNEAREQR